MNQDIAKDTYDHDYDLNILYAKICYFICLNNMEIETDENLKESCLQCLLKVRVEKN
jgi:hypothetical protein